MLRFTGELTGVARGLSAARYGHNARGHERDEEVLRSSNGYMKAGQTGTETGTPVREMEKTRPRKSRPGLVIGKWSGGESNP